MKKLIMVVMVLLIVACAPKNNRKHLSGADNVRTTAEFEPRIKLVEETVLAGYSYQVIDVDGHQYLSRYSGGIVHLESCKCKNK